MSSFLGIKYRASEREREEIEDDNKEEIKVGW